MRAPAFLEAVYEVRVETLVPVQSQLPLNYKPDDSEFLFNSSVEQVHILLCFTVEQTPGSELVGCLWGKATEEVIELFLKAFLSAVTTILHLVFPRLVPHLSSLLPAKKCPCHFQYKSCGLLNLWFKLPYKAMLSLSGCLLLTGESGSSP